MKLITTLLVLLITNAVFAQQNGSIVGSLTDKDYNDEPLPFANVIIKGTATGTTSDFDGLYALESLAPGDYTIQYSFLGYETTELPVTVEAGIVTTVDVPMGASAAALDEVIIKTTTRRESEVALLLEQKKATTIKESIGAEQLAKLGVSDASTATTKISGVSKTDGSGDVFVCGLGDRYLYTTLNGLPIPSDDVERKNIDLSLFPTRLISSIDVSKTTSPGLSADQASGNIDIKSRTLNKSSLLSISSSSSVNTEVMSNDGLRNFKASPNNADLTVGFYNRTFNTLGAIKEQSWNPETIDAPINRSVSFSVGTKIGNKLSALLTAGQSSNFEYRTGFFRQYRSNFIDDTIPDATTWKKTVASSALLDLKFRANDNHSLKFNSLLINKIEDEVFEGGRAGTATIFEETDPAEGLFQFIRDQNLKKTLVLVNQLSGKHELSEKNSLDWAAGYNFLSADEPNRIRNEVNFNEAIVQLGRTGGFQQRKSIQKIEDVEYNGRINDNFKFIDTEEEKFHINLGANIRNKQRDFGSQFFGVEEVFTNAINPQSIDEISDIFTQQNFDNGLLKLNLLRPDFYSGELQSTAGYLDVLGVTGKFTIQAGLRYQRDLIDLNFDVGNFPGRIGSETKDYRRLYPSVNLKYTVNEKLAVRFANSTTTTLPEFKEIAPFEYVSTTGQVTRGNVDINASINRNFDLKFEYFPSSDQLVSVTGFYKLILDPINKVQDRGSAGIFSYFNAGEEAEVYGIELEGRVNILGADDQPQLKLNTNISRMWHKQDLKEVFDAEGDFVRTFRYKNLTETGLQGASNWIVNTSLNYSTNTEKSFDAALSGNYASDRIFALGAPEIQTSGDVNYNDAIVENGFVMLDLILGKQLTEYLKLGFTAKNLLNPEIKRTQLVKPSTTNIETEATVLSYKRGMQIGVNLNYTF
jgi:hypothetical protein